MTDKLTFEAELNNIDAAIYAVGELTDFDKGYAQALKEFRQHVVNLQAKYAPRIEMTPEEFDIPVLTDDFMTFGSLKEAMVNNLKEAVKKSLVWRLTEEYGYDYLANFSEEELHYIWLHPETIINSETGKPFVEEENA